MLVPAKLNLYLHVTGKRDDGYHLLDTLIAFTQICDEIEIGPAKEFSLQVEGEFSHLVEKGGQNIVQRAFALMQQEYGRQENVAIRLVKNIPVGAGLGGGSADAAAALILLNQLWQLGLQKEKLAQIGLKLGADVPIFINRKAAFVSGIGEQIRDVEELPVFYALLVYPYAPVSTKDVFKALNLQSGVQREHASHEGKNNWNLFLQNQSNALEKPAISMLPVLREIIDNLSKLEACQFARMSGSGSTCFAVFADQEKAESGLKKIQSIYPKYWIRLSKILPQY